VITLPFPLRRARLSSFWMAMSLSGGLAVATLYVLRFPHDGFAIGAGVIVAFILAVPGLIEPQIAYLPYKAWNKLAQTYGRVARFYLMAICFFIVLTVISGHEICRRTLLRECICS